MLSPLYRSIWLLLAACYELVLWMYLLLQSMYRRSYDLITCSNGKSQAQSDIAFLERCRLELSKIPRHLSVVVGPTEVVSAELLSRLVIYALTMNIDCVSFYDTRSCDDVAKARPQQRRITFEQLTLPKNVSSKKLQENRFVWSMRKGEPVAMANGRHSAVKTTTNGDLKHNNYSEISIKVVMLTPNDGRSLIAKVCQELYHQRRTKEIQDLLKDRKLLMERIDIKLKQKLNNLPDPELSIILNAHTCTFGLLPWQTRFTEFHTIDPSRYFSVKTFAKVLYKYSRCEQRWGK